MKTRNQFIGIAIAIIMFPLAFIACKDEPESDPHTSDWGEWTQAIAPTCTEAGIETRVYKLNGSTETRSIAPLGHDWEWVITIPANGTTAGTEIGTCKHDSSHTETRQFYQFTTVANLGTWLSSQPDNTTTTPYIVKLNVSSLGGSYNTTGSAGYVLSQNDTKYVNLDLSGSTFTSIEDDAFEDCTNLTGVTIPASVTSIGEFAFSSCESLASVNIPARVFSIGWGAFYNCYSLPAITVDANNIVYISQDGVLYTKNKTKLVAYPAGKAGTSFTIPNNVTIIGDGAFGGCESLANVNIPASVTSIGWFAFSGCTSLASINIPNSVINIGGYAFSGCTSLASVNIPSRVTSIGIYAFSSCESLTSVNIPNSVTIIGVCAFSGCTSLTSINIPDSVTSIEWCAFEDCTSLTRITIPARVTKIEDDAFAYCTGLTAITVDPANITYSSQDGVLYYRYKTTLVLYPARKAGTSFTIPDSVQIIGKNAFSNCTSLASVNIHARVARIGDGAFSGCSSLTNVIFATGSYIVDEDFGSHAFPEYQYDHHYESQHRGGDTLKTAYLMASPKSGTYTRTTNGDTWVKQ